MYRTIREAIEGMAYGSFTTALYRYVQEPTLPNFLHAYGYAIGENITAMQKTVPGFNLQAVYESGLENETATGRDGYSTALYYAMKFVVLPTAKQVAKQFPWLCWLDVPTPNPYSLDVPSLSGKKALLRNPSEAMGDDWEDGTDVTILSDLGACGYGCAMRFCVTTGAKSFFVDHTQIELQVDEKPQA